jgi:hypothetical protein
LFVSCHLCFLHYNRCQVIPWWSMIIVEHHQSCNCRCSLLRAHRCPCFQVRGALAIPRLPCRWLCCVQILAYCRRRRESGRTREVQSFAITRRSTRNQVNGSKAIGRGGAGFCIDAPSAYKGVRIMWSISSATGRRADDPRAPDAVGLEHLASFLHTRPAAQSGRQPRRVRLRHRFALRCTGATAPDRCSESCSYELMSLYKFKGNVLIHF